MVAEDIRVDVRPGRQVGGAGPGTVFLLEFYFVAAFGREDGLPLSFVPGSATGTMTSDGQRKVRWCWEQKKLKIQSTSMFGMINRESIHQ